MKINDILYFSSKYRYDQINFDNRDLLLDAFEDRVIGFYLRPAGFLNCNRDAFATGVLCVTTIDFLARISLNCDKTGERIKKWLKDNIPEFDEYLAERFYKDFRNGLIHEGRVKRGGQFSYQIGQLIYKEEDVVVVNPNLLLKSIYKAFESYLDVLKSNDVKFESFKERLMKDTKKDLEL